MNVSQGNAKKHRNGHIRKDQLSTLSSPTNNVKDKIRGLRREEKKNKRKPPCGSCADIVGDAGWLQAHKEFLQTHSDKHQLPLSTISEPFVEQALWPWLCCHDPSCEGSLHAGTNWKPCAKDKCSFDVHASMKATCTCKLTSDHVGLRRISHRYNSKSTDTYFMMFL